MILIGLLGKACPEPGEAACPELVEGLCAAADVTVTVLPAKMNDVTVALIAVLNVLFMFSSL
jgi:hypothetical protein